MRLIRALAATALLVGCARGEKAGDTTAASSPPADANVKAAMVANAIATNPPAADSILKANGYTPESFQAEMFAIAADSSRSAAYAAAKQP